MIGIISNNFMYISFYVLCFFLCKPATTNEIIKNKKIGFYFKKKASPQIIAKLPSTNRIKSFILF